jgi:hypothetical protein
MIQQLRIGLRFKDIYQRRQTIFLLAPEKKSVPTCAERSGVVLHCEILYPSVVLRGELN